MQSQENQVALPLRPHTIFGVCEAIGEDFGFNPTFLRVPLAAEKGPIYMDVGLRLDCKVRPRQGNDVWLSTRFEISSLVDQQQTRYFDCSDQELPYGRQVVDDVLARSETAMPQAHCFLATELALRAQQGAQRLTLGS